MELTFRGTNTLLYCVKGVSVNRIASENNKICNRVMLVGIGSVNQPSLSCDVVGTPAGAIQFK